MVYCNQFKGRAKQTVTGRSTGMKVLTTVYEMNGEEHSFISLGEFNNSEECYNSVAFEEEGEPTYREIKSYAEDLDAWNDSFIAELEEKGYIIR